MTTVAPVEGSGAVKRQQWWNESWMPSHIGSNVNVLKLEAESKITLDIVNFLST